MVNFRTIFVLCQINKIAIYSLLPLLLLASNCSSPNSTVLDPGAQPYTFANISSLPGDDIFLADLDGNGFTEIITIDSPMAPGQPASFILLMTFEGKIVEQVNFTGRIIPEIHTLDYDDDGILELIVPFLRNDSLFVSFVNACGKKLFYFFLIDGKPRIEDAGSFNWDPMVRGFHIRDLDNDGTKELITVITTNYARLPRGILVHSLPCGKRIGQAIVGSPPRSNFLDDFDNDGQLEVLCFGTAPNNGANAGGLDDQNSYLVVFDLTPAPIVSRFQKVSDKYSNYYLFYDDFDANHKKELLAWTESFSERSANTKIVELDPLTFTEIKKRSFNAPITSVCVTNLDHDTQPEIVLIQSTNKIIVLNNNFDEEKNREFPLKLNCIKSLPDIDNDSIDEILVSAPEGDFLLDNRLRLTAAFPTRKCLGIIRRGESQAPQIVLKAKDHYALGILTENRFYLVKRYYRTILITLGSGIFLVLGLIITGLCRRIRLLVSVQSLVMDCDNRGFLLFDHNQKIRIINDTLRIWLGLNEPDKNRTGGLKDLFDRVPEVILFFNDTISKPGRRAEKTFTLTLNDRKRYVQLIMDPVSTKNTMKPFWLVTVIDKSIADATIQNQTWNKMAQKTAHEIKNTLTAIMLKLQRLQSHYRHRVPQFAGEFDLDTARIIERIQSLRRISKNFLKFINIENLNLVNTDVNEFLKDTANIIRQELPPDIQLDLKTIANLPMVKIDHDAIRSVLENLVSNAVNAMPNGGQITLTTQFFRDLVFPDNGNDAKDYISIEIQDTGTGIATTDLARLFEPDFTRTECGNGLGLPFVKKTVADHSGYVDVESEPGAGTTFSIYIPVI